MGGMLERMKSGENRRRDGGMRVPAHAWGPHVTATAGFMVNLSRGVLCID